MGLTKTLALCFYSFIEGFDVCERERIECPFICIFLIAKINNTFVE